MINLEKYTESIFNRQSENEIENLLYSFCCENGYSGLTINEAINVGKEYSTIDHWGCIRYNRKGINKMLEYMSIN